MQYFLRGLLTISAVLLGSTGPCASSCWAGAGLSLIHISAIQMRLDKIAPESLAPGEEGRP